VFDTGQDLTLAALALRRLRNVSARDTLPRYDAGCAQVSDCREDRAGRLAHDVTSADAASRRRSSWRTCVPLHKRPRGVRPPLWFNSLATSEHDVNPAVRISATVPARSAAYRSAFARAAATPGRLATRARSVASTGCGILARFILTPRPAKPGHLQEVYLHWDHAPLLRRCRPTTSRVLHCAR
jgi:hypothetical protein